MWFFFPFIVLLMAIVNGVIVCWCSTCFDLLISDESPLPSGKLTVDQASWVASLLQIGGLIGNSYFGYITNNFGRKWPLLFTTIPMILSTLLFWFGQNVYYLYASRLIGGLFIVGGYVIGSLFISEISIDW